MRGVSSVLIAFVLLAAGGTACSNAPREKVGSSQEAVQALQQQKLVAADAAASDRLGNAVALDEDTALVGSAFDDVEWSRDPGSASIYVRAGSSWTLQQQLTAPDGLSNDHFGSSVAVLGDTAIVGAHSAQDASSENSGRVYVFQRAGGTWALSQQLYPANDPRNGLFGIAVALEGDTLVVGGASSAFVFERTGGVWGSRHRLAAPEEATAFGQAVAISGDLILVGSHVLDNSIGPGAPAGAAYVFARSGSDWIQVARLTGSDALPAGQFGRSVALSGSTAVVGANQHDGLEANAGAAYVFVGSGADWTEQAKLQPADRGPGDTFGAAVALVGDMALVGAPFHEHQGQNSDHGSVYLFQRSGTRWTEARELRATDGQNNDHFGSALALSGHSALIGAPNDDSPFQAQGSAYVFRFESAVGDACNVNAQCVSGFCSDGRCCDTPCDGSCNACSVSAGAPRDGECTILPAGSPGSPACAPFICSGSGPTCEVAATCGSCASDVDCPASEFCNALGLCQPQKGQGRACEPAAGADCRSDACRVCATGSCIDGFCCDTPCQGSCSACAHMLTGAPNGSCAPERDCGGAGGAGGTTGATGGSSGTSGGTSGMTGGATGVGGAAAGASGAGSGSGGGTGTAGSGGTGGATDACLHVTPEGDDESAVLSQGEAPFRNVQAAIDFAASHRNIATRVCVAAGASCGSSADYPGPDGADLTMRNGIGVFGEYESTGWTRCADSTTVLSLRSARGVYFGSDIDALTVLDGFELAAFAADTTAAVSVDGARGARLERVNVPGLRGAELALWSYGIDVRNGELVVASSNVFSGFGLLEAVGLRASDSSVVIADGTTIKAEGAEVVTGVSLDRAPDTRIQDSTVIATGSSELEDGGTRVTALDVTGNASELVVERSNVAATNGRIYTRGISLLGCAGGAPHVSENTVSARGPLQAELSAPPDVFGIRSVDDCHPLITSNQISATAGNESAVYGVACFFLDGPRSRCRLIENSISIRNEMSQQGLSAGGVAVSCNQCDEVSRNIISGLDISGCFRNCNYASLALDVFAPVHMGHVLLVDGNQIEAGCGGGPIGLNGYGAVGIRAAGVVRIQNNRISGSSCHALAHVAKTSGIVVTNDAVAIHSNYINGGRADAPACTSAGITIAETGRPSIRNNIITPGDCFSGANIDELVADADPIAVQNNDFVASPLGAVLYRDQGAVDPKTPEEVDALADTLASGNFSAQCILPLTGDSPCVDRGTTNDVPAHDEQGEPRSSVLPDVGPDEWGDRGSAEAHLCSGSGLVHVVPNECMHDGGMSSVDDSLEVYCVNGRARFCLSGEACPWREALVDTPETCSRAQLMPDYPTYMGNAWCSLWNGMQNYECDATGQIFFPAATSGPYPSQ